MKSRLGRANRQYMVVFAALVGLGFAALLLSGLYGPTAAAVLSPLDDSYKAASSATVSPGAVLTYTIVISNNTGTPAGPAVAMDALPNELSYVSLSTFSLPEGSAFPQFDPEKRHITFTTVSPVAAYSAITVGFQVRVDDAAASDTLITNTAVISDGTQTVSREVVVQVEDPPSARILTPWMNQTITERGTLAVTGRTWTGSQTPEFPGTPVLNPVLYVDGRDWYQVNWAAAAGATSYVLQEARRADFSNAATLPPTSNLFYDVTSKSVGTYYYRVKGRNAYEDSFWSNVVSVTVTSAQAMVAEGGVAAHDAASYQPVVEVNIKKVGEPDNWQLADSVAANPVGDWWDWSHDWELPEEDEARYVVAVRGKDLAGNYNPDFSDAVTVTVKNGTVIVYLPFIAKRWPPIPYPPAISINPDDGQGNYTVNWSDTDTTCPECDPTSWQFQESTTADFSSLTIDEAVSQLTVQRSFIDKPAGSYFYRVRGLNSYGYGGWSATVSPVFSGYYEDFSDGNSGWPRRVYEFDDKDTLDAAYENGTYRAKILRATANNGYITNYKMGSVAAPWDNTYSSYEVEVRHYFAVAGDQGVEPYAGKAGLIFGANANFTTIYVLEWNFEGDCAVNKYAGRTAPISDARIPRTIFKDWNFVSACTGVNAGYNEWNTAKVVVNGNSFVAYINGNQIASGQDNDLGSRHRVGVLTGSWERTPVEGRFDDFSVVP